MTYASTVESALPRLRSKVNPEPSAVRYEDLDLKIRTFSTGCTYCNPVSGIEELSFGDGVVNLGFEDVEEAIPADLLPCFWAFENGFCFLA